MKTFVLLACLLAVAYASDPQAVKDFYDKYAQCAKDLNINLPSGQLDPKGIKCVLEKLNLYDNQGVIMKDKLQQYVLTISRDGIQEQLIDLVSKCIDEGYKGEGSNEEKSIRNIDCSLQKNIMDLLEKPL